jgi:hypothetical protein
LAIDETVTDEVAVAYEAAIDTAELIIVLNSRGGFTL